ncbi:MAG: prolyl oligopeptidase family serine peptidase, partial [Pseudobdellovibrionaceae bacterium]
SFKKNITQTVLDVQLLKTYLQTRTNIDTNNLTLSGFSLGAVMGITVGAFDQSFSGYGFLVGGVDMANILMNRIRNRPDSEVAVAMKDVPKDEAAIRHQIAAVDPMTWLHRFQNKRFFSLNAAQDDIVDFKNSVEPMIEALKAQGNQVSTRLNDDGHTPTGSAFKKMKEIFFPLNAFLINKMPSVNTACQQDAIN